MRSILVHPLTREEVSPPHLRYRLYVYVYYVCDRLPEKVCPCYQFFPYIPNIFAFPNRDHEIRNAWIGPSFPLDLSTLPLKSEEMPLQYPSLSTPSNYASFWTIYSNLLCVLCCRTRLFCHRSHLHIGGTSQTWGERRTYPRWRKGSCEGTEGLMSLPFYTFSIRTSIHIIPCRNPALPRKHDAS